MKLRGFPFGPTGRATATKGSGGAGIGGVPG